MTNPAKPVRENIITSDNSTLIIEHVKRWLDQFVIELNLCPFARRERANNTISFVVSSADNETGLLNDLAHQLTRLNDQPDIETTLLIHPHVLTRFSDYNQFLDRVDVLLDEFGFTGTYQVASFHPDYQFAGTSPEDPENYTNRSPWPLLHILREDSVERAIQSHPDASAIPQANIDRLNSLGANHLQSLLLKMNRNRHQN